MFRPLQLLTVLLVLICVLLRPLPAVACGPFSLDAVFTSVVHPEFPLEKFARGEIGVVQPTYARSYLVAAYRHLSGIGFSEAEQKQLVTLWQERLDHTWPDFQE